MSNGHIVSLYERRTRLEEDKANAVADIKEFYLECKTNGYDPKALRKAFKRMDDKDSTSAQEQESLVDLYFDALNGGGEE